VPRVASVARRLSLGATFTSWVLLGNGGPSDAVIQPPKAEGFAGVGAHFIEYVLDGVPCQAPLRLGLTVQRMLEGLLESAESGKEVRLE
jgi:predicted dehydrogenase